MSWTERFLTLKILGWNEMQIQAYVQRRSSDLADTLLGWLDHYQLFDLVQVPIFLEEVTDYWLQLRSDITEKIDLCEELKGDLSEIEERANEGYEKNPENQTDLAKEIDFIKTRLRQTERDLLQVVHPIRTIDAAIKGFLDHQLAKLSGPERYHTVDRLLEALQRIAFELDGGNDKKLDANWGRKLVGDDLDELVRMSLITLHRQEVWFGHDIIKLCLAAKAFGYRLAEAKKNADHLNKFILNLHGQPDYWRRCLSATQLLLPSTLLLTQDQFDWVAFALSTRK